MAQKDACRGEKKVPEKDQRPAQAKEFNCATRKRETQSALIASQRDESLSASYGGLRK